MKLKADPRSTRRHQRQLLDDKMRLLREFTDLQHHTGVVGTGLDWAQSEPH